MKVKIFSHQSDPDGIGCVILVKQAFDDVNYTLCKNITDLDLKLTNFIANEEYLNYKKIFITDLVPSVKLLKEIKNNEQLAKRLVIIDHHVSNLEKLEDETYDFVNISLDGSAMSLFYEYLKKSKDLIFSDRTLKEFVELTRLHDTWEWKKTNNLDAYNLEVLFHKLGSIGYLEHFLAKLDLVSKHFIYSEDEKKLIKEQLNEEEKYLNNLYERLIYKNISNVRYAIVYGMYNYRNSLSEKLSIDDCDVLIFMAVDNETVSFRSINENVSVLDIAKEFNGGGHMHASSCNLNHENEMKIIKKFLV